MVEMIPGARGPVLIDGASHFLQEDTSRRGRGSDPGVPRS